MKISITDVTDGKYGLAANDKLFFKFEGEHELILDKKSAFEIAWTLIDSLSMLTDEEEEFLYQIQDKLEVN